MKKMQITGITALSLNLAMTTLALEKPIKLASDARIEVVAYQRYNVVPIQGTTFTTTQITFAQGEFIQNVQNGDLGAWTVSIDKNLPYMMFIKPTAYHSNTNMTVVTNKHTYYFHLCSHAQGEEHLKHTTYAIHFVYPDEKKAKMMEQIQARKQQKQAELSAFQHPENYHWNYSFHGDRSIMPLHVFDDGHFTYLQLQPHQPIPAVFVITSRSGKEALVNYRQHGRYLVVQTLAPQFTLRLGKEHVASIFNNALIARLEAKDPQEPSYVT